MKYFFYSLLFFISLNLFGQGCSDAGFCTMGAMKPDQNYDKKAKYRLNSIQLSQYRGKSTLSPVIHSTTLEANFGIKDNTQLQIKLPYSVVKGRFGSNNGLGDISIAFTRLLYKADKFNISYTLGGKIPTNLSQQKGDETFTIPDTSVSRELPMYLQTSLGSYDIITGISLVSKKWLVAAGYQQALTRNKNEFKWGEWKDFENFDYVKKYDRGTHLLRGIDVMFRIERNWRYSKWNFNLGALPIYRITKDSRKTVDLQTINKIDKTTGLALSALAGAGYQFDVHQGVKFLFGYKLMDREVNPDGLTRKSVLSLTYYARF